MADPKRIDENLVQNPDGSYTLTSPPPITRGPPRRAMEGLTPSPEGGYTYTPPAPVSELEDIAKSAGTRSTFGVGDIYGLPGTLGTFATEGLGWAGRKVLQAGEEMGVLPEGQTPETIPTSISNWWESLATPEGKYYAEKYGNRADVLGFTWPSGAEVEKELRESVPALDYTPKTKKGEYAASMARMGTSSLAGGPGRTLLEKATIGAVGGAGSETAGTVAQKFAPDYEDIARILGAIIPTVGAVRVSNSIRAFTGRDEEAARMLAQAINEDLRDGSSKMTVEQIEAAHQQGLKPTPYDIGGTKTEELLSRMGGHAPSALKKFNDYFKDRNESILDANADYIRKAFGLSDRAGAEAAALETAHKKINDQLYDIARSNPAANAVTSPRLEELTKLPFVQKAMANVQKLAADPKTNIRLPETTPSFIPGGADMVTPGNINFWHHVQRDLRDQADVAFKSGEKYLAETIGGYRQDLLTEVENQVDAYKTARLTAGGGFGEENALKAGTMFANKPDTYSTRKIIEKISDFLPDELALFRYGVGDTLMSKAATGNPSGFVKFLEKPETAERLRAAVGDAMYDRLYGHAKSTSMMNKAANVVAAPVKPSFISGHIGLASMVGMALPDMTYIMSLPPEVAWKIVAGAAFDQTSKLIKYKAEQRIAPQVIKLSMSEDPADISKLGELLRTNPAANAFFSRASDALSDLTLMGARATAGTEQHASGGRIERASGGRTSIDHGAEADKLIALADKAKKAHNSTTEPLLDQPDEMITKALAIADKAI